MKEWELEKKRRNAGSFTLIVVVGAGIAFLLLAIPWLYGCIQILTRFGILK